MIVKLRLQRRGATTPSPPHVVSINADLRLSSQLSTIGTKLTILDHHWTKFKLFEFNGSVVGNQFNADTVLSQIGFGTGGTILVLECSPGEGILSISDIAEVSSPASTSPLAPSTSSPIPNVPLPSTSEDSQLLRPVSPYPDASPRPSTPSLSISLPLDSPSNRDFSPSSTPSLFASSITYNLENFSIPIDHVPIIITEAENIIEDNLFSSKGSGFISVIWSTRGNYYNHSKRKKEEKILALVRYYTGTFVLFVINPSGWRGSKFAISDAIPITDYPTFSRSLLRKPKDEEHLVVSIEVSVFKIEIELSCLSFYSLSACFNVVCQEMFSSEAWKHRVYSVQWSAPFVVDVDCDHVLDCFRKLVTVKNSQSSTEELIFDILRGLLCPSTRKALLSAVLSILSTPSSPSSTTNFIQYPLLILKGFLKVPNGDVDEVKAILSLLENNDGLSWSGSKLNVISSLIIDFSGLLQSLPLPDRRTHPDTPIPPSLPPTLYSPRKLRTDSVSDQNARRSELGQFMSGNSLILMSLILTPDNQSILIDSELNLPNHQITSPIPSDFTSFHSEFSRLLSFGSSIPLYQSPPIKNDPFPLRLKISEAFVSLKNSLSGLELGYVYDQVINLDSIGSKAIVTISTLSSNEIPIELTERYHLISFSDFEHDFYQKYLMLEPRTRLSTISDHPFTGSRYLSMIRQWRSNNDSIKPGFYLGAVRIISDLDGLSILTDSISRDCIPLVKISSTLPTPPQEAWLRTITPKLKQGIPLCPHSSTIDLLSASVELTFEQLFVVAINEMKSKLNLNDLGDLYDWELIPLDPKSQSKMIVFVSVGSSDDVFSSDFFYCPIDSFEVRNFRSNFYNQTAPLFRKSDSLLLEEAIYRLQSSSISDISDLSNRTDFLDRIQDETIDLERLFSIFRWYTRIVTWVIEGSKPASSLLSRSSGLSTTDLGVKTLELVVRESERFIEQFNMIVGQKNDCFDSILSAIKVLWSRYDDEDAALVEYGDKNGGKLVGNNSGSGNSFQPNLKPKSEIRESFPGPLPLESSFSFEDLAFNLHFELSNHDIVDCLVEEIVESALVEAIDVPLLLEIENVVFDCIDLIDFVDGLVELAAIDVLEYQSKNDLFSAQEKFRQEIMSLFNQPLPDYEPQSFSGQNHDIITLLSTPYTPFIKDHIKYFIDTFSHSQLFFENLDVLHNLEDDIRLLDSAMILAVSPNQKRKEGQNQNFDDDVMSSSPFVSVSIPELLISSTVKAPVGPPSYPLATPRSPPSTQSKIQSKKSSRVKQSLPLSSPAKKSLSDLRQLNKVYQRQPTITPRVDPLNTPLQTPGSPIQSNLIDEVVFLIENEEYCVPRSLLTRCRALSSEDKFVSFSEISAEIFNFVLEFLTDESIVETDPFSNHSVDVNLSSLDVLIAAELLQIPKLFIYCFNSFYSNSGKLKESIQIVLSSFIASLSISELISLEVSSGLLIFDLLWFGKCVEEFPEIVGVSKNSPVDQIISAFLIEQGEWSYTFASFRVISGIKNQLTLFDSNEVSLWRECLGERVFSLNLSKMIDLNDDVITFVTSFCPNLLYLNVSNTRISDNGLKEIVRNCDLLKEISLGNTRISKYSVKNLVPSSTIVHF
ncbi:hypothetical protein RCL1_004053 [Eukaryota sp. TZLM3-RCL]